MIRILFIDDTPLTQKDLESSGYKPMINTAFPLAEYVIDVYDFTCSDAELRKYDLIFLDWIGKNVSELALNSSGAQIIKRMMENNISTPVIIISSEIIDNDAITKELEVFLKKQYASKLSYLDKEIQTLTLNKIGTNDAQKVSLSSLIDNKNELTKQIEIEKEDGIKEQKGDLQENTNAILAVDQTYTFVLGYISKMTISHDNPTVSAQAFKKVINKKPILLARFNGALDGNNAPVQLPGVNADASSNSSNVTPPAWLTTEVQKTPIGKRILKFYEVKTCTGEKKHLDQLRECVSTNIKTKNGQSLYDVFCALKDRKIKGDLLTTQKIGDLLGKKETETKRTFYSGLVTLILLYGYKGNKKTANEEFEKFVAKQAEEIFHYGNSARKKGNTPGMQGLYNSLLNPIERRIGFVKESTASGKKIEMINRCSGSADPHCKLLSLLKRTFDAIVEGSMHL